MQKNKFNNKCNNNTNTNKIELRIHELSSHPISGTIEAGLAVRERSGFTPGNEANILAQVANPNVGRIKNCQLQLVRNPEHSRMFQMGPEEWGKESQRPERMRLESILRRTKKRNRMGFPLQAAGHECTCPFQLVPVRLSVCLEYI